MEPKSMFGITDTDVEAGAAGFMVATVIARFLNKITFGSRDIHTAAIETHLKATDTQIEGIKGGFVKKSEWQRGEADLWNALKEAANASEGRHERLLTRLAESERAILSAVLHSQK